MSAVKNGKCEIELEGKKYNLLFSLNVLDEIQDRFGGYDKLAEVFNPENPLWIKNTRWLFTLLINEGAAEGEPEITEKQIGKMLHLGNINEIQAAMLKAFRLGTKGDEEEEEEEEEGNLKGGQGN